jgi:hypothetical protein
VPDRKYLDCSLVAIQNPSKEHDEEVAHSNNPPLPKTTTIYILSL